ncbi:conserved hypothetical protein, partial [Perkinsus marinus ATCC 50983]
SSRAEALENLISDHCALSWEVHWDSSSPNTTRKFCGGRIRRSRRYASKTHWAKFGVEIQKMGTSPPPNSIDETEILAERVLAVISRAVRLSTPVSSGPKKRNNDAHWWSTELSRLRRECTLKQAEMRKARIRGGPGIDSSAESLRIPKRRYSHAIKKAKRKSFTEWASKLDDRRALKTFLEEAPVDIESVDAEAAASAFFGNVTLPDPYVSSIQVPISDMGGIVSHEEVDRIVDARSTGRAPGKDDVAYEHIRRAWAENGRWSDSLIKLMNAVLHFQFFPRCLQGAEVVLLRKKGRRTGWSKFRPISLSLTLAKVCEALIANCLEAVIGELPSFVHGFVANRSTDTAWKDLVTALESHRNSPAVRGVAAFDAVAAFNSISHRAICVAIERLAYTGFSELVRSFLTGQWSCTGGARRYSVKGIQQGYILSPRLYVYTTLDLGKQLQLLNEPSRGISVRPVLYADDSAIAIKAPGIVSLVGLITRVWRIMENWASDVDLTLSKDKNEIWVDTWTSEVASILQNRGHHDLADSVKKCIKFLGLWLDQK